MTLGFATSQISEAQLRQMLELVTRENTAWFLARLRAGRSVRSASEAGVRYCPDRAGFEVLFLDAETLLDQGIGSCGSIAAYDAGVRRARAQWSGTAAPVAAGRFGPTLISRENGKGVDYWHAVVRTPTGLYDPTRDLKQVCVTPSYA